MPSMLTRRFGFSVLLIVAGLGLTAPAAFGQANTCQWANDRECDEARYGGTGAYERKDQTSHAFLDSELTQLEAMAQVIPPIFLAVSAFLINMILSRLIALEREQIGLLKALGYTKIAIAALKIGPL